MKGRNYTCIFLPAEEKATEVIFLWSYFSKQEEYWIIFQDIGEKR